MLDVAGVLDKCLGWLLGYLNEVSTYFVIFYLKSAALLENSVIKYYDTQPKLCVITPSLPSWKLFETPLQIYLCKPSPISTFVKHLNADTTSPVNEMGARNFEVMLWNCKDFDNSRFLQVGLILKVQSCKSCNSKWMVLQQKKTPKISHSYLLSYLNRKNSVCKQKHNKSLYFMLTLISLAINFGSE